MSSERRTIDAIRSLRSIHWHILIPSICHLDSRNTCQSKEFQPHSELGDLVTITHIEVRDPQAAKAAASSSAEISQPTWTSCTGCAPTIA